MPKDVAMSIETVIGQSVRSRSCRAEPAAPRRMPAAAKRRGRRQGEGPPTPVKMAEPLDPSRITRTNLTTIHPGSGKKTPGGQKYRNKNNGGGRDTHGMYRYRFP